MRSALSVLLIALLASCSYEQVPVVASDVNISKPMPGISMTAGYLTLTNNTSQAITITHITSPQFASVEMHETVLEDGMVHMYPLSGLTMLPSTTVKFEPGGKHLMLEDPIGDVDTMVLDFHAGKAIVLTVNVALAD